MQILVAAKVAKFEIFDYILGRCIQGACAQHALKGAAIVFYDSVGAICREPLNC